MIDRHTQSECLRRMVATSTDPQYIRETFGQPHQYSRTFCFIMACIGSLAMWAIFFAIASI